MTETDMINVCKFKVVSNKIILAIHYILSEFNVQEVYQYFIEKWSLVFPHSK